MKDLRTRFASAASDAEPRKTRSGAHSEPADLSAHRRMVRPRLSERAEPLSRFAAKRRPAPPEETHAEAFYYVKQMSARTPMVLVLLDGEPIRGWIEWYDKGCLKVHRHNAPNLLVMKHQIKYMYKQEEEKGGRRDGRGG